MRLIARKGKFVCALLTMILSGSLFTRVVFADDVPKTVPVGDEQLDPYYGGQHSDEALPGC